MASSFDRELEHLRSRLNAIKSDCSPEQQAAHFDSSLLALRTHLHDLRAEVECQQAALDYYRGDDGWDDES